MKHLFTPLVLLFILMAVFVLGEKASFAAEKKEPARKPASPGEFVCFNSSLIGTTDILQWYLQQNCDTNKHYTVNYIQSSGYLLCCLQKN